MVPENPQVAEARHRLFRQLSRAGIVELVRLQVRSELGQECIDLPSVKPDPFQGVLGAQLLQDLGQRLVVPLGELSRAVVRDGVGGRLQV